MEERIILDTKENLVGTTKYKCECLECGKWKWVSQSNFDNGVGKFCNRRCKGDYMMTDENKGKIYMDLAVEKIKKG